MDKSPLQVYKVVEEYDGRYFSACQNPEFPQNFRVEYKKGEWVGPAVEGTKLFLFNHVHEAKQFRSRLNRSCGWGYYMRIFTADATNIEAAPRFIARPSRICRFWQPGWNQFVLDNFNWDEYDFGLLEQETPSGTVWADKVMLLEEV